MGIRYSESTIFEVCRRIETGDISYSEAQSEYGVKAKEVYGLGLENIGLDHYLV
ncbi:hypothetical protein [Marivirga arenosa]|uniref:Uncharacterized protein n=1 Tax=Marivirga arenosa TaxID=3059076 RepID=A0AA49GGF0_9BACT|nr:hypothetical protein [Marivirga sp. BKB1-2]WKK80466.1 hypothetical protein QYS47_25515 [Marivirga sp. BKB1-2]